MRTYTPAIKAKSNDINALALLSKGAQMKIKPLLEAPISIDDHDVRTHIASSVTAINRLLPKIPFYFDPLGIESSTRQLAAFEALAEAGNEVTPVVGLDRDPINKAMLRRILEVHNLGLCVRLELADLDDSGEDSWAAILQLSADLGLSPNKVELIIDYRQIKKQSIRRLRELTIDFLTLQPRKFQTGQITLLGSSALESVGNVEKDGMLSIARRELELWASLNFELAGSKSIRFGDYGVINPDFTFSGPNKNANAKIRYTAGSMIHYFRGHGLYNPKRFDQYHELSGRVAESEFYIGRDFSFGDEYIKRCSDREVGTGNLATWVKVDTNHHAELTSKQISLLASEVQAINKESEVTELLASM